MVHVSQIGRLGRQDTNATFGEDGAAPAGGFVPKLGRVGRLGRLGADAGVGVGIGSDEGFGVGIGLDAEGNVVNSFAEQMERPVSYWAPSAEPTTPVVPAAPAAKKPMSTNTKLILGGVGLLSLGLVVYLVTRPAYPLAEGAYA